MQPAVSDATGALLAAIRRRAGDAARFVMEEIRSRRWASVTFRGARHEFAFRLEGAASGDAAERFLAGLEAADFTLPGHILADIALVAQERRPGSVLIRLEALTVEEH
ncbi:MAG: hypothetical protein ACK40O_01395 [Allosphingosinicella sp.]